MILSFVREMEDENEILTTDAYEEHIHVPGTTGASSAGTCSFLNACYDAHVAMPIMSGLRTDKAVLGLGNEFHDIFQKKLHDRYARKPIPDVKFGSEIAFDLDLPDFKIHTKIDIVLCKPDESGEAFHQEDHKYRNVTRPITVKNKDAKWLQIGDIKTAGSYVYYKFKTEGLPFSYLVQGHIEMKATGLDEIVFVIINKEKGWMYEVLIKWNDAIWNRFLTMLRRRKEIADAIKQQQNTANINALDFECVYDAGTLKWWSCPFATVIEKYDDASGKPSLELDDICEYGRKLLYTYCKAHYPVGSMWKFEASHVTIGCYNEATERIEGTNKSGKLFTISYVNAFRKFTVIEKKEKK